MITPVYRVIPMLLIVALAAGCSSTASNECDEFLEGYEKYVMDYIDLTKQARKDPTDMSLVQKAAAMSAEAAKWGNKTTGCKDDPDFVKKYSEIQGKLTKAAMDR